jgi:excisionase family DNA binding protein
VSDMTPAGPSPAGSEPLYLTAEAVATLVSVSKATVDRWAKEHPTMPVLKIGEVVRFPKDRLLVWLRTREQGATARPRAPRTLDGHPTGHTLDTPALAAAQEARRIERLQL